MSIDQHVLHLCIIGIPTAQVHYLVSGMTIFYVYYLSLFLIGYGISVPL